MKADGAAEYQALTTAIGDVSTQATRQAVRRFRNELRAIQRRDYFPPPRKRTSPGRRPRPHRQHGRLSDADLGRPPS